LKETMTRIEYNPMLV